MWSVCERTLGAVIGVGMKEDWPYAESGYVRIHYTMFHNFYFCLKFSIIKRLIYFYGYEAHIRLQVSFVCPDFKFSCSLQYFHFYDWLISYQIWYIFEPIKYMYNSKIPLSSVCMLRVPHKVSFGKRLWC